MASPEIQARILSEPQKPAQERNFQNTLDFLAEATPTPRYLRTTWPPRHKNQTETNWQRNFTIAGRYFGTDDTLDEIGGDDLTRERIRQIAKNVVKSIHTNSSQEIQERFPLESFDYCKPQSRITGGRRISKTRGDLPLKVGGAILNGQSLSDIRHQFGYHRVYNAIHRLSKWSIEVPYGKKLRERFAGLADPELSDQEAQKILDAITRYGYERLSRGEKPVLIPVSKVARGTDLFFTSRDIKLLYLILKKSGVPASSIPSQKTNKNPERQVIPRYYFIRSLDTNRASATLKQILI